MAVSSICLAALQHCLRTAVTVLLDLSRFALLMARSRSALAAENLFLRKQLAFFQERKAKPRRAD
jgi:putative transposase